MASDRVPVGIHDLTFRTTSLQLTHAELARHTGVPLAKYHQGIGQKAMSIPAPDEDVITMAAHAAAAVVGRHGADRIRTLVFATETSVDQAKAGGLYVHSLLGLPPHIRVVELKQACYGATAALQFATALVHRDPDQQVLVLASDIARYDLDSPGEPTQGAAAAALLVTARPALLEIDTPSGVFTHEVMDFWRPNYRSTALVDGRASIDAYLNALTGTFGDHQARGGAPLHRIRTICYHQPFTRMAHKAHHHLLQQAGLPTVPQDIAAALAPTTTYNEVLGNSYTASLYVALAALLDGPTPLDGETVGLFSYGSGSVAEFLTATVRPGYRDHVRTGAHRAAVTDRRPISYAAYRDLHSGTLPTDGGSHATAAATPGPYRLAGVRDHRRIYEATGPVDAGPATTGRCVAAPGEGGGG
ncbi:hydroxymethylglutaryl-CoA synthase [Streptomyces sp. WAC07149]|uniref:hydroxymethylglutaryl-CoA synthase n=1 Tax=Streptomyces sp. WAC07149 TaxID=2487425 RepID=UPI000F7B8AC6|nr:hydroxymethylglutaryl-CoA synthase [Streptomyces sp. WAC07149]RST08982.1 hydroxymethylglutaryl-CoA synthase [Streptomyces sp. WAC07149]